MNPRDFAYLIADISSLSVVLPLLVYLVKIKKVNRPIHIIGALLIVAAMADLVGYLLFKAHQSTAMVFNTYYTLMFFLLCWFYYETLFKDRNKGAIFIGLGVYLISFIIITFFIQNFFFFQNLIWTITGIILIVYSIAYFVSSLSDIPSTHLFGNTLTWINTGVLFYFSFSVVIFSMGDYLFSREDPHATLLIWSTHNVNNILKNVLFTIGFALYQQRKPVFPMLEQLKIRTKTTQNA